MAFERSLEFALKHHSLQAYHRNGYSYPYIIHCLQVALHFVGNDLLMTIAVLHDIVEDTSVTIGDLSKLYDDEIVSAIYALTRRPAEPYFDYIERVKRNELATLVKLADLSENLKTATVDGKSSLVERYQRAILVLTDESLWQKEN